MSNDVYSFDEVDNLIRCCLSKQDHFVKEPRLLECGGNSCLTCINDNFDIDEIKCKYCFKTHTNLYLKNNFANPLANKFINLMSNELASRSINKCNQIIEELHETNVDNMINNRLSIIENEIDIKIESIKSELDLIKDEFKMKLEKIRHGLKNVHELQEKHNYLKKLYNSLQSCLNSISFKINDIQLNTSSIGSLVFPSYFDLVEFESINLIKHNGQGVETCCLLENKIIMNSCDPNIGSIVTYSVENKSIKKEQLNGYLIAPSCVCSTNNGLIIVGESSKEEILFYEANNFKLVKRLKSKSFASIYYLAYDDQTGRVYASYAGSNEVISYDHTGEDIIEASVDSPVHMKIHGSNLYVLNDKNYDYDKDDKEKFIQNAYTTNGIYVLDKITLKIIDKIQLTSWISPSGLWIDNSGWIYTFASEINQKKKLQKSLLYVINSNGDLVDRLSFGINEYPRDIVIYNKKLYFLLKDYLGEISFS